MKAKITETLQTTNHISVMGGQKSASRRLSIGWAVVPLFVIDVLCLVLSMVIAYQLRFNVMSYYHDLPDPAFYVELVIVGVVSRSLIFSAYHLYQAKQIFGGMKEYANVLNAATLNLLTLIIYSFLKRQPDIDVSRGWLTIVWALSVLSTEGSRFLYRYFIYSLRKRGWFINRALIIGANQEGQLIAEQLQACSQAGTEVMGFVDPRLQVGTKVAGLPVYGHLNLIQNLIGKMGITELIVVPTALQREELLGLYREWNDDERVHVHLTSGLYELCTTGVQVREVGFIPMVSLNRTRITGIDAFLKSMLDFVGAAVLLIALAPIFAVIALLIKLDSKGPVFYMRRVVGLKGKIFHAFKFRTMMVDADAYLAAHPKLKKMWDETGKIKDDPRITKIGRFLRRYSIDELPQLLNVLAGQMSLVGPRMITPEELRHFGPWQHNLMTVKPGMSGLWQVSGRSDITYDERVRLDMYYIRNYTVWFDIKILFNTIRTVLKGSGAY